MIFSRCPHCSESLIYHYESGEKPCGFGVFGGKICEGCGKELLIERVSIGGSTWVKEEFEKRHPNLLKEYE